MPHLAGRSLEMADRKFHYGWVVILTGLLVTIGAHGFGRMSYTLILPAMKDGLHFNYTELGLLGTGNFVGYLLMALIGGFLAARFGTRIVIALALTLMGITMILTGLAETFRFAFAMRLLTGLGNGAGLRSCDGLGIGVVHCGPPRVCHGNRFRGNWWRNHDRRPCRSSPAGGVWYRRVAFRLVRPLGGAGSVIAGVAGLLIRSRPEDMGLSQVGAVEQAGTGNSVKAAAASLDWGRVYKMGSVWDLGLVYFITASHTSFT